MAKLFGIGADTAKNHGSTTHHEDDHAHEVDHDHHGSTTHHEDDHHGHDIDIEIREERDHEADIGQIAVDVLDLAEELIIVAPVA